MSRAAYVILEWFLITAIAAAAMPLSTARFFSLFWIVIIYGVVSYAEGKKFN